MAVIIKDMEMPRKCLSCPLSHFTVSARGKYYPMCSILHQRIPSKTRLSDCPLRALEDENRKLKEQINNHVTVIPDNATRAEVHQILRELSFDIVANQPTLLNHTDEEILAYWDGPYSG